MSDVVPVNTTSADYKRMFSPSSCETCQHQQQSAVHHGGSQERRRTDGDQFRPAPVPGPGRWFELPDKPPVSDVVPLTAGGSRGVAPGIWNAQTKEDGSRKNGVSFKYDVCRPSGRKSGSEFGFNGKKIDHDEEHDDDVAEFTKSHLKKGLQAAIVSERESTLLKPATASHIKRSCSEGSSDSGCCACSYEIKELYSENEGLRIRVKGIETIVNVLKDAREELESERRKITKLNIAIGNLQSRLHRAGFDTSVDLAKNEIFIPGHDRSFVNGLISENGRLHKQLKDSKRCGDAGENVVELEKTLEELKEQLQKLQQQLCIKETQISTLETLLQSSDDAKTSKIIHLQDENQRASKDLKDVEETCKTLTAETRRFQRDSAASQSQLSQTLKDLAMWKEKAHDLEKQAAEIAIQKMEVLVQQESKLTTADKLKIADGQVEQLDKENTRLTEQLREVIVMNTRWQRYNEQRETHVLKLTKTNQHQQSKITVLEQQRRDLEQTINGLNVMLQTFKDEKRKNTDVAILSLEQQLLQKEDRISELAEEVSALKAYLQSSENERGIGQRQEDKSMIQTLQQQVKIYKDDFDQERKDRERLQGNMDILKHKLKDSSRKLLAHEQQKVPIQPAFYQQPRRLVARGLPAMYQDVDSYLTSDVEVDGVEETDDGPGSNTEPLQCPICAQEFEVSDHSHFMRHVGICLDQ